MMLYGGCLGKLYLLCQIAPFVDQTSPFFSAGFSLNFALDLSKFWLHGISLPFSRTISKTLSHNRHPNRSVMWAAGGSRVMFNTVRYGARPHFSRNSQWYWAQVVSLYAQVNGGWRNEIMMKNKNKKYSYLLLSKWYFCFLSVKYCSKSCLNLIHCGNHNMSR